MRERGGGGGEGERERIIRYVYMYMYMYARIQCRSTLDVRYNCKQTHILHVPDKCHQHVSILPVSDILSNPCLAELRVL